MNQEMLVFCSGFKTIHALQKFLDYRKLRWVFEVKGIDSRTAATSGGGTAFPAAM